MRKGDRIGIEMGFQRKEKKYIKKNLRVIHTHLCRSPAIVVSSSSSSARALCCDRLAFLEIIGAKGWRWRRRDGKGKGRGEVDIKGGEVVVFYEEMEGIREGIT